MGIPWFLEGTAGDQFSPTEYRGGGGGEDVENWLSINCWWRNQVNSIKTQSRSPHPPGDNNDRSIRHVAKKSYYILLIFFVYLQIPES